MPPRKFPFPLMEPGDSFAVPTSLGNSLNVSLHFYRLKFPAQKFLLRKLERGNPRGYYRCWRVDNIEPCSYRPAVESGIPVARMHPKFYKGTLYPIMEMEVGDSFAIPRAEARRIDTIRQIASRHKRKGLGEWVVRLDGERMWRVWRIK